MNAVVQSWGRITSITNQTATLRPQSLGKDVLPKMAATGRSMLAIGKGRSYGDVALNHRNNLLLTSKMDYILDADWMRGRVRAQAGLTLFDLHQISVSQGWISAVTPGTAMITLGGCVANDVHGKNHAQVGSFGAHVQRLSLRRSDGSRLTCDQNENSSLFAATIGGLGLTGLIEWVELQLSPLESPNFELEKTTFSDLPELFTLLQLNADWPHKAAWLDCPTNAGRKVCGVFSKARPCGHQPIQRAHALKPWRVPFDMPRLTLNRFSISAFNRLQHAAAARAPRSVQPYQAVLHPLDAVSNWNRLYGAKGLYQYQAIIPLDGAEPAIRSMMRTISQNDQRPFLAVLKLHGPERSPGLMSFCKEGVSLAFDFANCGQRTLDLLAKLDPILEHHGGRLYPAKDARMSPGFFQRSYPKYLTLEDARDPFFSSSFWRRVMTG